MRHDRPGYFWLIERYRRLGYDAARDRDALRRARRGRRSSTSSTRSRCGRSRGLDARARRGLRGPRASGPRRRCSSAATTSAPDCSSTSPGRRERPVRVSTWSSLAPLALTRDARGRPPAARRGAPAAPAPLPGARVGIPSVALEEPSFKPGFAMWRCWRGPSWMNTALAARAGDARARATRPTPSGSSARSSCRVDRYGYREYYNPLTGRGLAARGFGFSTLLVDLLAQMRDRRWASRPRPGDDAAVSWRSTRAAGHLDAEPRQVAVIDLGSNSWRLVVFTLRAPAAGGSAPTSCTRRSGSATGSAPPGRLSEEAMDRGHRDALGVRAVLPRQPARRPRRPRGRDQRDPRRRQPAGVPRPRATRRPASTIEVLSGARRGALRLRRRGQHDDADRRRRRSSSAAAACS